MANYQSKYTGVQVDEAIGKVLANGAGEAVSTHNSDTYAHTDIREQISQLSSEIVDIKSESLQQAPLFANSVDELNESGDTSKLYVLPDGYIYAYTGENVGGGTIPNFTDQLSTSEDLNSTEAFNGTGYMTGAYLTTSSPFYTVSGKENEWLTGYILYTTDKPIYIKGVSFTTAAHDRILFYSVKNTRVAPAITSGGSVETYFTVEQLDSDYYKLTPISGSGFTSSIKYVRMGFTTGTPSNVIITVDEPITYTTVEDSIVYKWENTNHAFVTSENVNGSIVVNGNVEFVNSIEECVDKTKLYVLPDGYIYANVKKTTEGSTTPNFKNLLDDAGYVENTYLSSGNEGTRDGVECTGYMPFDGTGNYVIYLSGITATASTSNFRFVFYCEDGNLKYQVNNSNMESNVYAPISYETGEDGNIVKLDCNAFVTAVLNKEGNNKIPTHFRLCSDKIDENSIITVNEEITYTTVEGGEVYEWKNTGHAFVPADYEDRIIALETDMVTAKQDIKVLQNHVNTTPSGDIIPQAVATGASELVNLALSRADGNVLRFLISSDAHQRNEGDSSVEISAGNKELGLAYGEILNSIGVDFVSNLGDSAWASYKNTAEQVREQIKQFNKYVYPYIKGEQILNCEGNHDDSVYSTIDNDGDGVVSSTEKFSLAETFSLIYSHNKNIVFDTDHYIDGYCYKDFEHLKVRVICLNTEQGTSDGGVVESYQAKWLEEVALNMTDKTDWQVVTLAHHPLSFGTASLNAVVDIIDEFIKSGGSYIGHFHGHAHAFSVVKMQRNIGGTYTDINAWEICVPNACYTRSNQYKGNSNARIARYSTETTYNKSNEDGLRTSFNLVTIDLDNKIIYADNYGAGINREISY